MREAVATASVVVGAAVVLWAVSNQAWTSAKKDLGYAGMHALSAPWAPPPADETAAWYASPTVEPPPEDATRQQLLGWLEKHYPALTIGLFDESTVKQDREIDLGGWPPRRLYVDPGKGLVMRNP